MTTLDDAVTTWRLAILNTDLDQEERTALRNTAERLEREWNSLTSMNVSRRLREHGLLDLFVEWGEQRILAGESLVLRSKKHAEWWERCQKQAAVLDIGGNYLRLVQ